MTPRVTADQRKRGGSPLQSPEAQRAKFPNCDEVPFAIAKPPSQWTIGTVMESLPMSHQAKTNDLYDVLVHLEHRAGSLKPFYRDWRQYRFADGDTALQILDEKALVDQSKSFKTKRSSPVEILKAILTCNHIREASQSPQVAVEASKRALDYIMLFELCKDHKDAKPLQRYLSQMKKHWDGALEVLKSYKHLPPVTPATPSRTAGQPPASASKQLAAPMSAPERPSAEKRDVITITDGPVHPAEGEADQAAMEQRVESSRFKPGAWVTAWDEVILDRQVKNSIRTAVYGLKLDCNPSRVNGMLLYGTPGTGKSVLVAAIATAAKLPMFRASKDMLMSKFQGESEKNIRGLFEYAAKQEPSIIFFDELDTFTHDVSDGGSSNMPDIRNLLQTLWSDLANQGRKVLVIGTTNKPGRISEACLRRLSLRFHITLPTAEMRAEILVLALKAYSHTLGIDQCGDLGMTMGPLSGDDIKQAVKRAGAVGFQRMVNGSHFVEIDGILYACNPEFEGAFEADFFDLSEEDQKRTHHVPFGYLLDYDTVKLELGKQKVVYTQESLRFYETWTKEYGCGN